MIVLPRTRDRELVDCYHGGLQGNIQGCATCWATGMVLRRVLLLAGCILATTLGLRTAERGPVSGTAPRHRPAHIRGRLS